MKRKGLTVILALLLSLLMLSAPALAEEDRGNLPLLAALWEGGCLPKEGLKIT